MSFSLVRKIVTEEYRYLVSDVPSLIATHRNSGRCFNPDTVDIARVDGRISLVTVLGDRAPSHFARASSIYCSESQIKEYAPAWLRDLVNSVT